MTSTAKIYGLILAGGKSMRMGTDKGRIAYHGIPQREHLYRLLEGVCDKTFMSIRKEQVAEISSTFNTIVDEDIFKGPFNGILSAHKKYPNVAWLVLACDLPLIDEKSLRDLIAARKRNAYATAYSLRENSLPEPLAAIWEPKGLKAAISYMEAGTNGSCPRKFLINNDTHLVYPTDQQVLMNANSELEYWEALTKLT
ncbi:NTP transferase domain-containing protein [Maribacter arenosus]|uniref:NTP transferase domain-containing protein n=1 Tax=Maribacter arenosus TaxID=1854708 RepID=A0ABR7V9A7_9FLAO|nr:NTP transferase domain-containing protein [Maribacter arenosus]MBD0849963.1 NTP transferase domain-containing protein [Maribacter arenosus]